jgi:dynein heavy chain, axonemal
LKKCFEGIASLSFTEALEVTTMRSAEGEEIELVDIISTAKARGQVEKWLQELEGDMKKSIHRQIKESFEAYMNGVRHHWVLKWPGQCVQSIAMAYWTQETTECFYADQPMKMLGKYHEKCKLQVSQFAKKKQTLSSGRRSEKM